MFGYPLKFSFSILSILTIVSACNTSATLTNVYNIPFEEISSVIIHNKENKIIELSIGSTEEFEEYLSLTGTSDSILKKNPINFHKECVALIAYPQTDLSQQIYIDMIEQKSDTLKLYYSVISTNELTNEVYQPYKVLRLRKKHKVLQIIKK